MSASVVNKPNSMSAMQSLNAEWWNDSCDLKELAHAVKRGAAGATSNPVIVSAAVQNDTAYWGPEIDRLVAEFPTETEDQIAWRLIEEVGRQAAGILNPVFQQTKGRKGYLCLQVNPKLFVDADRMVSHAKALRLVAENIAIKVPCTEPGLQAIESLTANGIAVNVTVSFSVAQALAAAEAIERGLARAKKDGASVETLRPYVTLMEGRVDDFLFRVAEAKSLASTDALKWSGVAVFKKLARLFKEKGFSSILLAAAYRHELHWSEIVGSGVIQSIPYSWWTKFDDSGIDLRSSLEEEVPEAALNDLLAIEEFHQVYDENGLAIRDFARFDASRHTLNQFINGYHELLEIVRTRMLA